MSYTIKVITHPAFEWVGGRAPWRVVNPLVLIVNGTPYTVPTGYCTDFASVPRIPGIYWRYGNSAKLAALWHDWCYDCGNDLFTRKEADQMFLALMDMFDDPSGKWRRRVMYAAVRLGGWRGWRKDTTWKCKDANTI